MEADKFSVEAYKSQVETLRALLKAKLAEEKNPSPTSLEKSMALISLADEDLSIKEIEKPLRVNLRQHLHQPISQITKLKNQLYKANVKLKSADENNLKLQDNNKNMKLMLIKRQKEMVQMEKQYEKALSMCMSRINIYAENKQAMEREMLEKANYIQLLESKLLDLASR
eukprot:TRINITY_DN104983_c0_g1_i1.p1 TRINITY_DN104983_c0_g1~~TRINITY_DN104983_c0_g1_i1.p1  ORF type:complete len:170 (-),score=31.22 TRINITY_DN104983_c0_g1_i1:160-669(-)